MFLTTEDYELTSLAADVQLAIGLSNLSGMGMLDPILLTTVSMEKDGILVKVGKTVVKLMKYIGSKIMTAIKKFFGFFYKLGMWVGEKAAMATKGRKPKADAFSLAKEVEEATRVAFNSMAKQTMQMQASVNKIVKSDKEVMAELIKDIKRGLADPKILSSAAEDLVEDMEKSLLEANFKKYDLDYSSITQKRFCYPDDVDIQYGLEFSYNGDKLISVKQLLGPEVNIIEKAPTRDEIEAYAKKQEKLNADSKGLKLTDTHRMVKELLSDIYEGDAEIPKESHSELAVLMNVYGVYRRYQAIMISTMMAADRKQTRVTKMAIDNLEDKE